MSEPEQCIICLDHLPRPSAVDGGDAALSTSASNTVKEEEDSHLNIVAALDGCEHVIHDTCIRSWAQKTNTCPICRNPFHSVRVYNGADGTVISKYDVEDKKQVAEFDVQQWLAGNPEEEEEPGNPCPICDSAEREDVLLLCDSCDAAYHTYCVGIDEIPGGDWYCMECRHLFDLADAPSSTEAGEQSSLPQHVRRPNPRDSRGYHVRTRARLRRARRQARNAEWQGAWGQFSGRFYEMSDLDLDNHDDEDEDLEQYRRFQQLDRRELQRWQQRLSIAQRLGAQESFAHSIPPQISEQLRPTTPIAQESVDERRAWGALERARGPTKEAEEASSTSRKRKARSISASPGEPAQEPERKLKRPRTRRLVLQNGEGSSSAAPPAPPPGPQSSHNMLSPSRSTVNGCTEAEPPLVSSLLKELEPSGMSDDENTSNVTSWRPPPNASSPALSPITSAFSSPRALSLTPPPLPSVGGRPISPTLSLSTHIEPSYPPANYSPTRQRSNSDVSEVRLPDAHNYSPSRRRGRQRVRQRDAQNYSPSSHQSPDNKKDETIIGTFEMRLLELRQPRPRRPEEVAMRTSETSPTRWTMTQEEKRNINDIVKGALRPHWRAQKLTTEQYAIINRDISRRLYDEVKNASSLDDETRRSWEKRVNQEVAQAVSELPA